MIFTILYGPNRGSLRRFGTVHAEIPTLSESAVSHLISLLASTCQGSFVIEVKDALGEIVLEIDASM